MKDLLTEISLVGAAVLFAMWLALIGGRWLARQLAAIRPYLAAFVIFTFVAMNYAQKPGGTNGVGQVEGGTNELMRTTEIAETAGAGTENGWGRIVDRFPQPPIRVAEGASVPSVVEMFLLESVATNDSYSFSMPSNGVRHVNWWLRGAYEDVFRLDLGEMRFPCGTNLCDSLWVYTWGMAGAKLGDASNRLVATGVPMSAVPGLSQFWSVDVDGGAKLLTWENFFLNRDTNTPVSAQLELMPSGDLIARSNLVETVYRRVNPDDWDDDGISNDDDLDPLSYDGDNFGPHQQLPEGANSNAYCWVDLVVAQADSLVRFVGDGYSALPDPTFIAKAGATNRVTILIGKTYQVTSRMPITCLGQSSGEIEVWQVSPMELSICWPVMIEASAMRGGSSFSMSVWPDWLGGGFTWTNSCCSLSSSGWTFTYSCNDACHCTGCAAMGYYGYESYRLHAYGGSCGCSPLGDDDDTGDDDEPLSVGVSVLFSKDAVLFESSYTNSNGQHVNGQSTTVRLICVVRGGTYGGQLSLALSGEEKLLRTSGDLLPAASIYVPSGEVRTFSSEYFGRMPSGVKNDIVAYAAFAEDVTGNVHNDFATLTAVRVKTHAQATWIPWSQRKELGVGETVLLSFEPSEENLEAAVSGCTYAQNQWKYTAPPRAMTQAVIVNCMGCELPLVFQTLEPAGLVAEIDGCDWFGAAGVAGGFVGTFDVFVVPTNVSFGAIQTREVGCISTDPSGVFTNSSYAGWLDHSLHGAGNWHGLNQRNKYYDTVTLPEIQNWVGGGSFTWPVPNEWRMSTNGVPVTIPYDSGFDQRFEVDADGTSRIKKFHWILERLTNSEHSVVREAN